MSKTENKDPHIAKMLTNMYASWSKLESDPSTRRRLQDIAGKRPKRKM